MTEAAALSARQVSHRFAASASAVGAEVLRAIDVNIRPGEFVSLVGPSGCGKSTLLRLFAGLISPSSGEILADKQRLAFVFQDATLLPWRTVRENIALPLELAAVEQAIRRARTDESLALIGLTNADGDKFPRELSGGMRMRVSLARALVTHPDVLLLDEPFAALDDLLRQQLNEELLKLWQLQRWTAVFVTHNVSEAVFLSQRVLVMSPRPGTIAAEIDIDLPYPRAANLRTTPAFTAHVERVTRALRSEKPQ